MKTERLIDELAGRLSPVRRGETARVLATGLLGGGAASFALMMLWLGIRPDLAAAAATSAFWMKFAYTLALALSGFLTLERLARPGTGAGPQAALEALPPAALAVVALLEWNAAAPGQHLHLLMGASHTVCPWRIVALAIPVFVGALWSLRRLAPTRPLFAGAAAGLAAGALGAWIYAFHCDESSAVFVVVWYTFGVALVGLLGALVGRWALRW